jgi:hypothetical protein
MIWQGVDAGVGVGIGIVSTRGPMSITDAAMLRGSVRTMEKGKEERVIESWAREQSDGGSIKDGKKGLVD